MTGQMIDLHLGAHKTASTHLQKSLRAAFEGVPDACFLGPSEMRAPAIGFEALAAAGPGDPLGAEAAAALRRRIAGVPCVLISEENVLGTAHAPKMLREARFYPRADARLAHLVAGLGVAGVRLHLAVRDPAGFLVSAYCQRLYAGQVLPFAAFLGGLQPHRLRWSELLERLLAVPGVAGVTLWRYEAYPAVLADIAAAMMPARLAARVTASPEVVHPGLSRAAHDWVMAEAAAGTAPNGLARTARARWPKLPGVAAFAPFDAGILAESAAAYAADVDRMAAVPGVRLIGGPAQA